jgi:hypothetical protein
MVFEPTKRWKSPYIIHLVICQNQNSPTDFFEEAEILYAEHFQQYKEIGAKLRKLYKQFKFPFDKIPYMHVDEWTVYEHVFFNSMAELDTAEQLIADFNTRTGGEYQSLIDQQSECLIRRDVMMCKSLSNKPNQPSESLSIPDRIAKNKLRKAKYEFYYFEPGKADAGVKLYQEFLKLLGNNDQENKQACGHAWECIIGPETPIFITCSFYNDGEKPNLPKEVYEKVNALFTANLKYIIRRERVETYRERGYFITKPKIK